MMGGELYRQGLVKDYATIYVLVKQGLYGFQLAHLGRVTLYELFDDFAGG